jgi:serine/threonine protein kinase
MDTSARFCPSCGSGVVPAGGRISDTTPLPAIPKAASPTSAIPKSKSQRMLDQLRSATVGEYDILAELGSGGMATVFLAHDLQLDRRVAIKLMHPALVTGEGMAERFILEARTAAGLSHPNIIPIYAVRVEEEQLFFVMKFVEGRPLDSIIAKESPLPADMVRQIVSQVAEALGYAHKRGVIHRDIKPANIMISTDGQPVLTDFGIAKVADKQGLTMTGATIGTPTYMSPEQCNALPLTGASDQYSLGVMAYEMLTGRPLFDADSVMTIMFKHINEPVRPVIEQVKDCPPDLATTIDRMLAKNPEDRYPQIEDVAKAINTPSATSENQVRTQLVQFALAGANREVLKRVSTPRSPIPSSLIRKPKTRVVAAGVSEQRRVSRPLLFGGIGVIAAGAVALAMTRPWEKAETPSPSPVLSVSAETSTTQQLQAESTPPPVPIDEPVVQPDTQPTVVADVPRPRPPAARSSSTTSPSVTRPPPPVTRDTASVPPTVTPTSEPVAAAPPPVTRDTTPPAPATPAGPTEAELRAQVAATIQAYAAALENSNIQRVRLLFPGMSSEREQQLRQALPEMRNLRIQLLVGQVDLSGETATATVTGRWVFNSGGQRNVLPADNTYSLERRGQRWVITGIR